MCPKCDGKLSIIKSVLVLSLVLVGIWTLDTYASGNMDHSKMKHVDMKKNGARKKLDVAAKKSIISVLEANEELHSSFFKYDGKKVETAAQKLKTEIENIKDPELSKLLTFSKNKLGEIKASKARDDNNQNYHLVSMALIHVVNTYDIGSKYNAYSCPMVKKKWVQNSEKMAKVHNPYAPKMPHCGSQDSKY